MQYFSPHDLADIFSIDSNQNTELIVNLVNAEINFGKIEHVNLYGRQFEVENVKLFLEGLNGKNYLFCDWVRMSPRLYKLLTAGQIEGFRLDQAIVKHEKFNEFKVFITPFLIEILNKEFYNRLSSKEYVELAEIMVLFDLLDPEARSVYEKAIQEHIENELDERVKSLVRLKSREDLEKIIDIYFNKDVYKVLNALSPESYSIKTTFVHYVNKFRDNIFTDVALNVALLESLKSLDLKASHLQSIDKFLIRAREGKLNEDKKYGKTVAKKTQVYIAVGIVLFLTLIVTVAILRNNDRTVKKGNASLFGKEMNPKKVLVDSLMLFGKDIKSNDLSEGIEVDYIYPSTNKYIQNSRAKKLQHNLFVDYTIQRVINRASGCNERYEITVPEYKNFNMGTLMSSSAYLEGKDHELYNNCGYQIYMVLFNNKLNTQTYGEFIDMGETVKIKVDEGFRAFFYVGRGMTEFFGDYSNSIGVSSNYLKKMLNGDLNFHFCSQTKETRNFLDNVYAVDTDNLGSLTVINHNFSGGFYLESDTFERIN